jgi:hypothetical protein
VEIPVQFDAELRKDGALEVTFDGVPLTANSSFLLEGADIGDRPIRFGVQADTGDKRYRLSSGDLIFSSVGTRGDTRQTVVLLAGHFLRCSVTWALTETQNKPILRYFVRGLRGFHALQRTTALGTLRFGASHVEQDGQISGGQIELCSDRTITDIAEWRSQANIFLNRLLLLLGFAAGTYPKVPLVATYFHQIATFDILRESYAAQSFCNHFIF